MTPDVVVIGAGIHGCATALHLALAGLRVCVLEKDAAGAHASGVNAGSVHHIARLTVELPLAEIALSAWPGIAGLLDDDCGFRRVGHLKIAESEAELETLRETMASVHQHSHIREEMLDRQALRDAEPCLSDRCLGAIWSPDCGYALPGRAVQAFRARAVRAGVEFRAGEEVIGLARRQGSWDVTTRAGSLRSPRVVNCAGAWGNRIAALAGESIALTPMALMLTVLARMPPVMHTVIGVTGRLLSIKQFANGTVVIGGGYRGLPDLEDGIAHLHHGRLGYNLRAAMEVYPILRRGRVMRFWAGLEGRSADGLPVIGPSAQAEGLWHGFAFSSHGFFLGPAVGALLAEWIATGAAPAALNPFSSARFSA